MTTENNKEFKSSKRFVFNTVKTETSDMFENTKIYNHHVRLLADGQSFSVTNQMKSKLGLFKDYKRTETYSLSDDEKHLIIRTFDFPDVSSVHRGKKL